MCIRDRSGGQKQLLNLASVMAMQPKVLVLDEPTSQLDPIAASEFLATIRKINLELGTTVIIIEHRLEEVFPMADKVLVLEEGRQILYDEPRQVGKALAGNDLFLAMPSPVQIYDGTGQVGTCPLTCLLYTSYEEDSMMDAIVRACEENGIKISLNASKTVSYTHLVCYAWNWSDVKCE